MSKPFWRSKTLWFNALVALGAAVESQVGMLKAYVGPEGYVAMVMLIPAVNTMLRIISKEELGK